MNVIVYILACCLTAFPPADRPNPVPKPKHQFTVIAHRGDHLTYPENTLAAYNQAIKDGADYVEIDLRTTRDGRLISLHNESVDRMTDGTGLVKDLTYTVIKKLHIKAADSLQNIYSIPGFEEILKLCKNRIYIYIDFKDADPKIAFTLLKQFEMENQVLVYINKPEQFTAWRAAAPKMPLMLSLPNDVKDSTAMLKFLELYHPDVLDGNYKQYNRQLTSLAQSRGLAVWPDGQTKTEGAEVWEDAINKGLAGLQTDHPLELINYLKSKKIR